MLRQGSLSLVDVDRELEAVRASEQALLDRMNALLAKRAFREQQKDRELADIEAKEDVLGHYL